MIYGLSGASCSGKTTLAKKLSKKLGIPFIPTSITEMAAEAGLPSPVADLDLGDRVKLQVGLLKAFERFLGKIDTPCIIDRTPADLFAYTFAEIGMHSIKNTMNWSDVLGDCNKTLVNYRNSCIKMVNTYNPFIIFLSYLPNYKTDSKRPPVGEAYQIHCEALIKGFLTEVSPKVKRMGVYTHSAKDRLSLIYSEICYNMAQQRLEVARLRQLN